MQRSKREGWLDSPEARLAVSRAREHRAYMTTGSQQASAVSPATALQQELAALNSKSRLGMARGLAKAAAHVETLDGQEVLEDASNIKQTSQSLALVHGWAANAPAARIDLRITGAHEVSAEQPSAIEAEWSDADGL